LTIYALAMKNDSAIKPPSGYEQWSAKDRFEDRNGPIFIHKDRQPETGQGLLKFYAEQRHCNGGGAVHGGMLMTFADSALFAIARRAFEGDHGVTVTMNNEFVSAAWPGDWLEADGELVRKTKSGLMFVRGQLYCGERTILLFSGLLKRIKV
jgi:acyl-coenzyme A thioesterase 13